LPLTRRPVGALPPGVFVGEPLDLSAHQLARLATHRPELLR
jgi:hypothetical protein